MAEAEVRGGAMAAECVEVAATDEDELRHAESGGAAGQCAHVVAFGYVVHQYIALYAIFFAHFLGAGLPTGVRLAGQMGFLWGFVSQTTRGGLLREIQAVCNYFQLLRASNYTFF